MLAGTQEEHREGQGLRGLDILFYVFPIYTCPSMFRWLRVRLASEYWTIYVSLGSLTILRVPPCIGQYPQVHMTGLIYCLQEHPTPITKVAGIILILM
jgi:hypothetical protein